MNRSLGGFRGEAAGKAQCLQFHPPHFGGKGGGGGGALGVCSLRFAACRTKRVGEKLVRTELAQNQLWRKALRLAITLFKLK
jgi:hypothetical protein